MNGPKRRKLLPKRDEQSTADDERGAEEHEEEHEEEEDMNGAKRRKIPPRRDKQNEADDDRGAEERGAEKRGAEERGAEKRGQKRGAEERGQKRGAEERGAEERGAEERGAEERGQKRGAEERGQKRGAEERRQKRGAEERGQKRGAEERGQKRGAEERRQKRGAEERGAEERGAEERGAEERGQKRGAEERGQKRGAEERRQKRGAEERGQKRGAEERRQKSGAEEQEMNEAKRKKFPPNRDEQSRADEERGAEEHEEESGEEELEWETGAEELGEERAESDFRLFISSLSDASSYDAAYSFSRNYPAMSDKQRAPRSPVYSQFTSPPVLHTAADPVRKTSRTETGRLTRQLDASSYDAAYSFSSRNYPPLSGKQRAPRSPVYSQFTSPPVLHTEDKHRLNNIQENQERSKSESGGRDQQKVASKNNNKYYILALIVGVVVGIFVDRHILWPTDTERIGKNITKVPDGQSYLVKPDPVKPDPVKPDHPEEDFVPPKPKPDGGKVKVYSKVTGKTFGAHQVLLDKVKSMSRSVTVETTEDLQESDIVIAFCPITSRVGSDVEAAMTDITASCGQKPVILVLMHHTRDVEYSTEGRRWSDEYNNIVLDVHVLFHETKSGLLMCPKNDQAAGRLQQELQKHADKHRLNIQENHEGSKSESGGRDQQKMDFNNNTYYILVLIVGVVVGIVVYRLLLRLTEEEARFIKNLSNVEGAEMDSVKLICEVSKPSADVTWYKGDEELPEGGRYDQIVDGKRRILLIQNLKMDDAGEYFCKLSPSITTSGNLTINELAAEFISKPHNQEVLEGKKAEFTCFISKENYQVRWMKDEKELEEGDKYQMISDGKRRTLIIKNCDPKDEGGYVLMIGPNGASVNLTVEEEARFIKNLSNVEGAEMDSVKLICHVSKPSADVTWYKGDEELPEGGRYDQMVDGKRRILLIQNLKMDDAGEYYCKLSPSITTSGNLTINELAAEFISKPHNQEVLEGKKAEFTCFISKENYQVRWMKDEKELKGDKYQMISDGKRRTLYIRNCDPKDEGGYVLMIGPNGASVNLTVGKRSS
ncbi:Hypothetical predicted protein [Scomber scombrus]|uniref:Ig-like domain-containing protein n=1 Tax=Scomber scombrus TaxID=13677 RepID=A0AAV1PPZ1_SCOSC